MCALGYYLERAGIMTTSISLVRENAASLQPPRTLWVSFPLGRPLGVPGDAAFQHRVIETALGLLTQPAGPVLEDYPEDAPQVAVEEAPACPVSFRSDESTWPGRLANELASLTAWYEIGRRRRNGRSLVGVCESEMPEILERFAEDLEAGRLPTDLEWFKAAIEDAKSYYVEALTAQPGSYDAQEISATLWHDTQLGAALRRFHDGFVAKGQAPFARIVLPREALEGGQGAPTQNSADTEDQ